MIEEIDEETFFEITIGGTNKQGSVHYFNVKYNKNFAKPSAEPKYQVIWGYEIDPEDRVRYSGINHRLDAASGKLYLSGCTPKAGNDIHTALSEFLVRALIIAIRKSIDLPTKNVVALAELRKILKDDDFPSITFKPHYSETYYDKKTATLKVMEQPRATFEFDSNTWAVSSKMPESLSGNVKSRIYTIATAADVEVMKEKGFNKKKIAAYEENLPAEDDDEETIERKLIARYKTGAIPRPWDALKTKPITAIGGNSGFVFGQINFPGTLQLYKGEVRVKPSFGKCTFIPEFDGSGEDSSSKYMNDDDEMLAFSRATAKTSKVVKGSKGSGKLANDSGDEDAEVEVKKPSKLKKEAEEAPAKKAPPKKASSSKKAASDDDATSEDDAPVPVKKAAKKAPPKKAAEDDESSEDEAPPKKPTKKAAPKKAVAEDDDESSEDEAPKKAPPTKKAAPKKVAAEDDDATSEDEAPKKPAKKVSPKKAASDDDATSEDEAPKKPAKKAAPSTKKAPKKTADSDYDDDE